MDNLNSLAVRQPMTSESTNQAQKQQIPRFTDPRQQFNTVGQTGSGLDEPQTLVRSDSDSLPRHADHDPQKPPVSIYQEEIYNLPSFQQKEAQVLFDTAQFLLEEPGQSRDLVFFSRKRFESHTRVSLRERLKCHSTINQDFASMLQQGARTVGASADCSLFVMLKMNFEVIIFDRRKNEIFQINGLNKAKFTKSEIDVDPFSHDFDKEMSEATLKDQFQLSVSNDGSMVVVSYKQQGTVWVWARKNEDSVDVLPSFKKEQLNSQRVPKPSLKRSNSVSKEQPREKERSTSRLKQLFSLDLLKLGSSRSSSKASTPKNGSISQVIPENKLLGPKQEEPTRITQLTGVWTNITIQDQMQANCICQSQQIRFFAASDNTRVYGSQGKASKIAQSFEDMVLTKVEMYDSADYFAAERKILDDSCRVLLVTQQTVTRQSLVRGRVCYESPFMIVRKSTKLTQIEHQGVMDEDEQTNLICRPDNQNSLLAIVTNSPHLFYCQLFFINPHTDFATCTKLFEFQQQYESPPLDKKGKANLQVDDLQWTLNDAFLVLMFSTGAMAVLPRLGSQLLQIYNPTLGNVASKDTGLFEQYQRPKIFNQLIVSPDVAAHVKKLKSELRYRSKIFMHPFDLAFTVYDGQVAYVMRIELEPELTELFDRKNMAYFFMRFCFSMRKLASDPEILEKIPKLLTNKLPLFEVEKNLEAIEDRPEQRVMTAAQISPFQFEDKRMETVQSFDAQFDEEPQVVLLNFKNLLFALRWNKDLTVNYLQWLVQVVNDCVYFFVRRSEPVYAFHTLVIAEFYIKKVLHKSEGELQGPEQQHQQRLLRPMVEQFSHLVDPTREIYDYRPEIGLDKSPGQKPLTGKMKVAQRVQLDRDFTKALPMDESHGSMTNFMFERNYILLVHYSLIQFRNYQASNFNIINLLFACYIVQKYLCKKFAKSLQTVSQISLMNHLRLEKTDEVELFFGKVGSNLMRDVDRPAQKYACWQSEVMRVTCAYHSRFFEETCMHTMTKHIYESLDSAAANPFPKLIEDQARQGITYLSEIMPVIKVVQRLQNNEIAECLAEIANINLETGFATQNYGIALTLLTNFVELNLTQASAPTLNGLMHAIARSSANLEKQGTLNMHSRIFRLAFRPSKKVKLSITACVKAFGTQTEANFFKVLGLLCFTHGDIEQGCRIMHRVVKDQPTELMMHTLHMLSACLTQQAAMFAEAKEKLKDFDINKATDLQQVRLSIERLNTFQVLKTGYSLLDKTLRDILKLSGNSRVLSHVLWQSCDLIKPGFANQAKVTVALHAVKAMKQVIKQRQAKFMLHVSQTASKTPLLEDFPAVRGFMKLVVPDFEQNISFTIGNSAELQARFFQQFEVLLVCLTDQSQLFSDDQALKINSLVAERVMKKLAKILHYFRVLCGVRKHDSVVNQLSKLADTSTDKLPIRRQIDANLIKSLKLFLSLVNIESMVAAQQYVRRNIHVLSYLLMHPESTVSNPEPIGGFPPLLDQLIEAAWKLPFTRLNRENKSMVAQVAEQVSQRTEPILLKVANVLSSQLIDAKVPILNVISDFPPNERAEILSHLSDDNLSGAEAIQGELWRIQLQQYQTEITEALQHLDIFDYFQDAHAQALHVKADFLSTYHHARKLVNLPVQTSLFYKGSCFELREQNLFGLTDEDFEDFDQDLSQGDLLQRTVARIDQTQQLHAKPDEVQAHFFEKQAETVYKSELLEHYQALKSDQAPCDEIVQPLANAEPVLQLESEGETTSPPIQVQTLKLKKGVQRRHSITRILDIQKIPSTTSKLTVKKLHLPPKPKPSTNITKDRLLNRLALIGLKDTREAFRRFKLLLPKIRHDQRFNLIVLQPDKSGFKARNPIKLYKAHKPIEDGPAQPFNLMSVQQVMPKDAQQEAEQKVLGKKVKIISHLEKKPVKLHMNQKHALLKGIMKRMEDVGAQVEKLKQDFESTNKLN